MSRPPPRYGISARVVLCSGESPQPSGSGYRGRVVSPPASGDLSAARLGLPVAGLVRDTPPRGASPILFPRPDSPRRSSWIRFAFLGAPWAYPLFHPSSRRLGGGSSRRAPILSRTMVPPFWPGKAWFPGLPLPS